MNKKVLKVMIALTVAFLLGYYVLKIFFPEQFVMAISNENIIAFGKFIDKRLWLNIILNTITAFITYWLYTCACCKKVRLGWKISFIILIASVGFQFIYYYVDTSLFSTLTILFMLALPAMVKADSLNVAIVFGTHYLSQWLSLKIRNLPMLLTNINYATIFLMTLECYFWLLLFYFYNNYRSKKQCVK